MADVASLATFTIGLIVGVMVCVGVLMFVVFRGFG